MGDKVGDKVGDKLQKLKSIGLTKKLPCPSVLAVNSSALIPLICLLQRNSGFIRVSLVFLYYGNQKYHYSEITKLVILKYINTTLIYIN
jgi:hypothetical protein